MRGRSIASILFGLLMAAAAAAAAAALIGSSSVILIPPNCTLQNQLRPNFGAGRGRWTCPEATPTIFRDQLCNQYVDCRSSYADEKICVDYGPSGVSYLTFVDEQANNADGNPVPRAFVPNFDCSAPMCVDRASDEDLMFKAHLLCKQMGGATYATAGRISNVSGAWPTALADTVRCTGHESTFQECVALTLTSMVTGLTSRSRVGFAVARPSTPMLISNCSQLLTVRCSKGCSRRVLVPSTATDQRYSLTSPGYPRYILPQLDCMWTLSVQDDHRVFIIDILVLNLQQFNLAGPDTPCTNSFVELGLGFDANGTYVRRRICDISVVGQNFTSYGNKVYIRYVSGQYLGDLRGAKGFALNYRTVSFPVQTDPTIVRRSPSTSLFLATPIIVLVTFLLIFIAITSVVSVVYHMNKRNVQQPSGVHLMRRLDNAAPMFDLPDENGDFNPPVICETCQRRIQHVTGMCSHYARLLEFVIENFENAFQQRRERPRRPRPTKMFSRYRWFFNRSAGIRTPSESRHSAPVVPSRLGRSPRYISQNANNNNSVSYANRNYLHANYGQDNNNNGGHRHSNNNNHNNNNANRNVIIVNTDANTNLKLMRLAPPIVDSQRPTAADRSQASNVTVDIDELIRGWQSTSRSGLSNMKTATSYESSLQSYSAQVDSSFGTDSLSRRPSIAGSQPQLSVAQPQFSGVNFLQVTGNHRPKSNSLSTSSWRTPSPRNASTPNEGPSPFVLRRHLEAESRTSSHDRTPPPPP